MENTNTEARDQRIIEYLQNTWQSFQGPSPKKIASILKFIRALEEPYKNASLEIVAEHISNAMKLHILSLMTTFHDKAEEENILQEDCEETFNHILPDTFHILEEISSNLSIQNLDHLIGLANITESLQILSNTNSAEEAQNWMYGLPDTYYQQLKEEHFLITENTNYNNISYNINYTKTQKKPFPYEANKTHMNYTFTSLHQIAQ